MNVFNRIGNWLDKTSKKENTFEDKYWKLKREDRLEYDSKMDKLAKGYDVNAISMSVLYLKAIFWTGIFFLLLTVYFGDAMFEIGKEMILSLFSVFPIYLCAVLVVVVMFMYLEEKAKQKIKKRFKLI